MAGHNKWSKIKRKKGVNDAKRGALFTKLIREITVAARDGGGDPEYNARLRLAVDTSKGNSMPAENIERAIKKGTGELAGVAYEEAIYEGYGPGGVALYIECLTDNTNRTVADVRHALNKNDGSLGTDGCSLRDSRATRPTVATAIRPQNTTRAVLSQATRVSCATNGVTSCSSKRNAP